jgi:hypothetical protein
VGAPNKTTNNMKPALKILLNGKVLGTVQLRAHRSLISWNWEKEVQAAIATVCFLRDDDLLMSHGYEDFVVKGVAIQ